MGRWIRHLYQPCLPIGEDGRRITASWEHRELSRRAAAEGMVLLKNDNNTLPIAAGTKVAVFGKAQIDYVKGGGGSGDVTVSYTRNLYEGLKIKEAEGKLSLFGGLSEYYKKNVEAQYADGVLPGLTKEPEIPAQLLQDAKAFTDTAIITICRFSREDADRKGEPGDYYLSEEEVKMVKTVTENFAHIIVVLNVGGVVDSSWFAKQSAIDSVLLAWQGGIEGGLAAADILCGDENPSGKLVDTFAASLEDYPSTKSFHESIDYVEYTEDIYMGYRYFETIPGAAEKVNYPFGYGLSYTEFQIDPLDVQDKNGLIEVQVQVTNVGQYSGKETVQLYYSAPQGLLGKPTRQLGAFAKTKQLEPGESEQLKLTMNVSSMASYDDQGLVCESAYVLEKGDYSFYLGNSVRNTVKLEYTYQLQQDRIISQLSRKMAPVALTKRMLSDGSYVSLETSASVPEPDILGLEPVKFEAKAPKICECDCQPIPKERIVLQDVADGKATLDEFLSQLDDLQLIDLLGGQPNTGVANTLGIGNLRDYGVPSIMTADGPAGLRIHPCCGVTTTAWPCETLLACSWNTELMYQVGAAAAKEIKENNIGIWLAPGMNIHRNPLCGRNFEYFSEDPLITGKMAAAEVIGVQSVHIGATIKHFACNNKETNRMESDSRVSERALREIYLKGFEIAVKEAQPWLVMSSYNKINGIRTSENKELLTDILREEWGFKGLVVTDWWNHGEQYKEIKAGNDVKMGCGYPERVQEAMKKGAITRKELEVSAARVLQMILKMD